MRKMPYKPPFLRDFPGNKKAAHAGGRLQTSGHFVSKRLCKGVWIVDVIIVEDVLVLFRECIVRHSHLIHRTRLVQPGPPAAVNEPVEVKSVFLFIGLRRITVVRMPFQIILGREERGQAPKLQNTFISRHGCKFGWGHQFPAQPLGILTVAFRLTTGAAVSLHTDCGFSQPVLGYFLDGAGFAATEEHHAVHVAEDCLGVLIVNGLALCQLLIQQAKTHLAGADNRDQLFELGHLSRVGCLVPQHPYMVRQAATVNIVRPFTQEVEHLRKCKCH